MKRYIAALMAAVMLLAMCCGCGDDVKENPEVGAETKRFVIVDAVGENTLTKTRWIIWCDTETGVLYGQWYHGMTVLLDADGKPLLYEEE